MSVTAADCGEALVTYCTAEWFHSTVDSLVCFEIPPFRKCLVTHRTAEAFRFVMGTEVFVQTAFDGETLTTYSTAERFLSTMGSYVSVKVTLLGKTLATLFTFERFRPGMGSNMPVKVALEGETLPTFSTYKWLFSGMRLHMPVTADVGGETPTTYFTVKRLSSAMGTEMLVKGGLESETLPTHWTFKSHLLCYRGRIVWWRFLHGCLDRRRLLGIQPCALANGDVFTSDCNKKYESLQFVNTFHYTNNYSHKNTMASQINVNSTVCATILNSISIQNVLYWFQLGNYIKNCKVWQDTCNQDFWRVADQIAF